MTKQNLTMKEKEAIGLLSIGTFLEYFDLTLYVHMAVLLNEIFFPNTDPLTSKLLAATAFCSTYLLRPIAGYVVGKIGDNVGRKFTIIITTFIMTLACLIMVLTPSYAEIGIVASILIIVSRMLQGFSSLGELMGAQLYITEILKVPTRCVMSGVVVFAARVGNFFALSAALVIMHTGINWRWAFGMGLVICIIGFAARTRLRESIEYVDYKKRVAPRVGIKVDKKSIMAFFFTELHIPIGFSVAFVYLGNFMKENLGLTPGQVVDQNLKLSILIALTVLVVALLAKKFHPIKMAMFMASIFVMVLPFIPFWLSNVTNLTSMLFLQFSVYIFCISTCGTLDAIQYKYFPVEKRFSIIGTTFGFANPLGYILGSFGLIYLTESFGSVALLILFTPIFIGYCWALYYYRTLEIQTGNYHHYPYKDEDVEKDTYVYNYELSEEYKPYQNECTYSKQLLEKIESLNRTAKKKVDIKLVKKAIAFAKKCHDGQMRKSGEPYYTHPLAVAMLTADYKFQTHMIVAAILHDVVEDSNCTFTLIKKEFSPRISEIVKLLTRKHEESKLTIGESVKKIIDATDYDALLIKGLDRIHNLQTIHFMGPIKTQEIAEETIYKIANVATYAVDNLNINDKNKLERELYNLSNKAVEKKKN